MSIIRKFFSAAWDIFLEMAPYLLLGFLIAGILNVVIKKSRIVRYMGKRGLWSSVKAALLGVPLPLCSCGVIPTGVSFHKNGASKGATTSFLISTPQTGVDSILITYSMMNIYWAIFRPIVAFVTGVIGGGITDRFVVQTTATTEVETNTKDETIVKKVKRIFSYAFVDFLGDISRQLLVGILIAVLITAFIPTTVFTNYLNYPILNMLIALVVSIPLYVCATGSVPIGAALLIAGVSPGAVLVFLMAGPATNAATLTVLWKSLGRKTTLIYLSTIILGAMLFGILIDYVLPTTLFTLPGMSADHLHEHGWFAIISAILLILLLIFAEIKKLIPIKPLINTTKMNVTYTVEGMTCNHCKSSVETNLQKIKGIKNVVADPNQNRVSVEGDADEKTIQNAIDNLGFSFKGKLNEQP